MSPTLARVGASGPRLRRPVRELLGLLLPKLFTEPTRMLKKTMSRGHDSAGPSYGGPGRIHVWPAETGGVWSRTSLCGSTFIVPIQALAGFVRVPPEVYLYSAEAGASPDYGGQSGFSYVALLHGVRVQQVVVRRVGKLLRS